jgi:SAM-dependent methyltransferase
MHVNYEYLLDFIQRTYSNPATGRFLDYGCGAAQVVMEGRRRGWEFFGADVFYATGKSRKEVEERGLLGVIVKEIQDNHLDFPDEYFDIIVNNQVFEHVEDINGALREIDRVLKPGGIVLSVFPAKGIVIEPHWKVPFVHWFPNSKVTG